MTSLLAVLAGFLMGSFVNAFVNFEGRNKPLVKWYFRLYCKDAVSIVTTAGLGLIFYVIYTKMGITYYSLSYMILAAFLSAATIKDIKERIIPNKLILFGLISGVVLNVLFPDLERIVWGLAALVFAGGVLLITSLVSKGGVGVGDAKLVACTGLLLGIDKTISVMIISFIASALFGILSMLLKKLNKKSAMPFAPFVLLGVLLTMLLG